MDVFAWLEGLLADEDAAEALQVCSEALEDAGLDVEIVPEVEALVASRGEGGLAFSGHVDVVPVTPEAWTHAPFGGQQEGERIYGRGASDMRGPVACMLAAIEATDEPVQIALTTDEETRLAGVRHLVDEGALAEADLIVVGEPTQLAIATAGKGLVWARLETTGERGHASTPRGPEGRAPSAAERLVEALADLGDRPLHIEHPELGPATLAISGLETEDTPFNVLAGRAEARIDVRFPPPKTPEDAERALRSRLGLPDEHASLSLAKREPSFLGDEPAAKRVQQVLQLEDIDVASTGVSFVSEAGHWQRVAPTLIVGPGSIDRAHAPDEFITREELTQGVQAYTALIEAWG